MRKIHGGMLLILFVVLLVGCNQEPRPEDRMTQYIELWKDQKFAEMYDYLSTTAQATVSKEDFVSRYEKIYSDLGIQDLTISFVEPEEEEKDKENSIHYPFSASMESVAGKIEFDHS